jgi:DNA-binding MarR family transcriptional regulator
MRSQPVVPLPCLCASLRRSTRALTQMYEEELHSFGLSASQFTILQVLDRAGELRQGQLGAILAMDSTTLTRTLKIMLREEWLAERSGQDRRERLLSLSPAGKAALRRATPAWQRSQSRLRRQLGKEAWDALFRLANQVTEITTKKKERS